jgi:ABC-type nitrate/sulfonate/bicarbonate transport system substrate-binding protein
MLRKMPRTIVRRIAPFALLASFAAHGQSPVLAPLTVQLDWKPTAQFAGILAAKQQGYYAAEGLDVTIVADNGNAGDQPSVKIVAAHAKDATPWVGITEADELLSGRAAGLPLQAFATIFQTTPFALLALKSSGMTSIKSLKGKTIGLHDDGEKALDVLLKFNGMTRQDVHVLRIPYTLEPLIDGQADAIQGYTIDEAVRLEMEHHPINIIPMAANGYVSYAEVLFTPTAVLRDHPQELTRFLLATGKGWRYAAGYPDATAQMIVTKYIPEGSVEEQKASLLAVLKLLYTQSPNFGMMQRDTWTKSIQMFETYKLVDRKLNAKDAVSYAVLDKLYPH